MVCQGKNYLTLCMSHRNYRGLRNERDWKGSAAFRQAQGVHFWKVQTERSVTTSSGFSKYSGLQVRVPLGDL